MNGYLFDRIRNARGIWRFSWHATHTRQRAIYQSVNAAVLVFPLARHCRTDCLPRCGDAIGDDDGISHGFSGLPRQSSAPQRAAGFTDLGAVYHSAVNLGRCAKAQPMAGFGMACWVMLRKYAAAGWVGGERAPANSEKADIHIMPDLHRCRVTAQAPNPV